MTAELGREARGEIFLSVFLAWMLTAFAFGISVVALLLIALGAWGRGGADPGIVSALAVTQLIVGLGAAAVGIVVSLARRAHARAVARIVLGVVVLSAAATIGAACIVGMG